MQATDAPCSLKHNINVAAIETVDALPPRRENAAIQGDVRPMSSGIVNIKDEILRLADHGLYAIPVHITIDPRRKSGAGFLPLTGTSSPWPIGRSTSAQCSMHFKSPMEWPY
jgi:hypothetical protein